MMKKPRPGRPLRGEERRIAMTVTFPPSMIAELDAISNETGYSKSEFLELAVRWYQNMVTTGKVAVPIPHAERVDLAKHAGDEALFKLIDSALPSAGFDRKSSNGAGDTYVGRVISMIDNLMKKKKIPGDPATVYEQWASYRLSRSKDVH